VLVVDDEAAPPLKRPDMADVFAGLTRWESWSRASGWERAAGMRGHQSARSLMVNVGRRYGSFKYRRYDARWEMAVVERVRRRLALKMGELRIGRCFFEVDQAKGSSSKPRA
jgi:hypothetical protein